MHLKYIKLSGFKSFVDLTQIPFPSQLVAIVGPNGCGKSNVIDAVRWVMGEGSAKTLRGVSMTDVIFNGSSERKAVGQASVELVFDNSLGRLGGQYASYQEIAIKRSVTRDGDSFYFLNGSRCRRKDITDIFLGTGAGSRSYSIIGQNTVSQFIEAKPDELREYLEEAAGVSIYKERRKETLNRIERTRENLLRIKDLQLELTAQLQRLEKQAKAAEKYKQLKENERKIKTEILVNKWRDLTVALKLTRDQIVHQENHYAVQQKEISEKSQFEVALVERLNTFQEQLHQQQEAYYEISNEIVRREEKNQQQTREKLQLQQDREQLQLNMQTIEKQLHEDSLEVQLIEKKLKETCAQVEECQNQVTLRKQELQHQQLEGKKLDDLIQEQQLSVSQLQQKTQANQLQLNHVQQRTQDAMLRYDHLQNEKTQFENDDAQQELNRLQEQEKETKESFQLAQASFQQLQKKGIAVAEEKGIVEQNYRSAEDSLRQITTQYMALEAAQKAALSQIKKDIQEDSWYAEKPRLVELIEVEEPWRAVCEWVLGQDLYSVVIDDNTSIFDQMDSILGHEVSFIMSAPISNAKKNNFSRLLDKITSSHFAGFDRLENVLIANSFREAISMQSHLENYQSVVTQDGFWIGSGWVKVTNFSLQDEGSFLLRKKELSTMLEQLEISKIKVQELQQKRETIYAESHENARSQQETKSKCDIFHRSYLEAKANLEKQIYVVEQNRIRLQLIMEEQDLLLDKIAELKCENEQLGEQVRTDDHHLLLQAQILDAKKQKKAEQDILVKACVEKIEEMNVYFHQIERQYTHEQLKLQQLQDTIYRGQVQTKHLHERKLEIERRIANIDSSEVDVTKMLSQLLENRQVKEEALNFIKQEVLSLREQEKEVHIAKSTLLQHANATHSELVQLQMEERTLSVRLSSLEDSNNEFDPDRKMMHLEGTSSNSLEHLELMLKQVESGLLKLGAVNLIAIEEYQEGLSRKENLDKQSDDLSEAIEMLMHAIEKMDAETEVRLRNTFEEVNGLFQTIFPRLFGGGRASLLFTGDNLLEAGIVVQAQPPGKRNNTIHLLSGGEKALTAVALVFAIFQMNPSPFCMLDEVDAPLDDLNNVRFCDLLKEMSQYVQFILITHKKLTMELADHLIGVTMQEPGVSRVVTVDVEQALSLKE